MDLSALEQERLALEETLAKLKKALRHWQTWEAEYEGLKEEIDDIPINLDEATLTSISKTYDGELLDEKEIRDLTGLSKGNPYSASQILNVISRRQEYVQKSIETLQRQYWEAEGKLETLDFAARSANKDAEGSLPITEINEELDDDDNIISSKLVQPGAAEDKILDALKKAGLSSEDLISSDTTFEQTVTSGEEQKPARPALTPQTIPASSEARSKSTTDVLDTTLKTSHNAPERPPIRKKSVSFTADTKRPATPVRLESEDGKKTVSFAEKVAVASAAPLPDLRTVSFAPQVEEIPVDPVTTPAARSTELEGAASHPPEVAIVDTPGSETQKALRASFKPGDKVYELGEDDELVQTHYVLPEDETEDEARLRREMIDYHLNEVGHVVAQLNLEDNDDDDYDNEHEGNDGQSVSDFTASERLDEDTPYTSGLSDSEEDEDEFGRSSFHISEDYHQQMQDLQARLIGNIGPAPSTDKVAAIDPEFNPADARKLVIQKDSSTTPDMLSDADQREKSKKRVSFAEALDVAQEEPISKLSTSKDIVDRPLMNESIEESIAERPAKASKPVSKFKQSRMQNSDAEDADDDADRGSSSSTHSGNIIAEQLKERISTRKNVNAPSSESSDAIMQRRELAEAYYRRRNDIIRQQGGFKVDPEEIEEHGELMEERDGKLKKVSRFKAARIRS